MFQAGILVCFWLQILLPLPSAQAQCSGTATIFTSEEATALADCGTYDGDVTVRSLEGAISFNGLEQITGDLSASVVNDMTSLSSDSLQTVGGRLTFQYADLLASLSLPSLRNVGTLSLQNLPNLTSIDAGDAGFNNVTSITVRNTALGDLSWLRSSRIDELRIEANPNLTDVTVAGLSVAESYITVENNSPVSVSFPDLVLAYNVSIQGCNAVSLPLLGQVNRSISLIDNSVETLELPSLLEVGGDFMLWNNSALSSVSVPLLANVSNDIVVSHNPKLGALSFPDLGIVEGDISTNGTFSEIDMPSLTDVQGDVTLRSTTALNCSSFEAYNQEHVLKARYICESGTGEPVDSSSSNDSSSSPSGGGGLSTGAKAGIAVGVILGVAILALGAFWFWRRSKKSRENYAFQHTAVVGEGKERYRTPGDLAATSHGKEQYAKAELPAEGVQRTAPELHGDSRMEEKSASGHASELAGGEIRHELPGSAPGGGR